ncbi:MAG: carboxypeptidase regulatory-like domain-containing protein [Pyrinomonadaceae bacterium]|nr:energy transducer TonB [Chloracidobacterium sp.]
MKIIFAMFSVLVLGISAWLGQVRETGGLHTLHGTIKDPTGAVISGLRIRTEATEPRVYSTTDINGDFRIVLPPGDHILVIDPPAMYDFRVFIKISENGLNPDNLEFVIDPSRGCCSTNTGQAFPKPIDLPKPKYPAAAKAVRAGGEVAVQLKIDREGKVISAEGANGHPLLRAACLIAAKASIFEVSEQPEREARLVYVFVPFGEKVRSGLVRYSNPYRIDIIDFSPPMLDG